ncbi:MAG: hypothetical protein AAF632_02280 [Bacteroidota bacterium]
MNDISIIHQNHDNKIERPIAITIICILGFIGTILSVPMVFSDIANQIGSWFPPYSGSIAVVNLVCMIGLWFTRKWAAYAYTCLVVLNQIVLIAMHEWHILTLAIQVIVVAIILLHLDSEVKSFSHQLARYVKRQIWAIIVAYMIGIHNFYREENKTPEDIVFTVEDYEEQGDSMPKE